MRTPEGKHTVVHHFHPDLNSWSKMQLTSLQPTRELSHGPRLLTLTSSKVISHSRRLRSEVSSITIANSELRESRTERRELTLWLLSTLTWTNRDRNAASLSTEDGFLMILRTSRCTNPVSLLEKSSVFSIEEMLRPSTLNPMSQLSRDTQELIQLTSLSSLRWRMKKRLANSCYSRSMKMKEQDKFSQQLLLLQTSQSGASHPRETKLTQPCGSMWPSLVSSQTLLSGSTSEYLF